jgi:hypothetical protein
MRVEVYTGPVEAEPILRLKLEQRGDQISLVAVDRLGVHKLAGVILSISAECGISRHSFVSKDLGLPLNQRAQVQLSTGE